MRTQRPSRQARRSTTRLSLEPLEDRSVPAAYALTDLGSFAGTDVTPYDINESGQVVGTFRNAARQDRAFLWDDGVLTELPTLGGPTSAAYDINDLGQVVGTSAVTPGDYNTRHAFLWDSAHGMQDLGTFQGATWSGAAAINDAGQIVGNYSWPDRTRTFLWEDGQFRDLFLGSPGDINEAGVVAGAWESTRGYPAAATWDPVFGARELGVLPGAAFSAAYGLNDAGQVVGYSESFFGDHAVLWEGGQMTDLGGGYAVDVNNDGQVIGYGNVNGAFIWRDGAMAHLNDLVPAGSGLSMAYANAINDAGQIVVTAYDAQGVQHAVLLTPLSADAPLVSIGDVSVTEGHTGTRTAAFTVTLSTASGEPVTVAFAAANGTAVAGSDYQAASGTVTFSPGETTKTVTVTVNGDRVGEPNENFVVNLSQPTNAVIADGQGVGTIVDDEPRISINDVARKEGHSGATLLVFTVTLSAASDVPVTVNFATADGTAKAGEDYDVTSGTLTFAPGETSKTITVVVRGDKKREADETFSVNLSGAVGALTVDGLGLGTILDDDRR